MSIKEKFTPIPSAPVQIKVVDPKTRDTMKARERAAKLRARAECCDDAQRTYVAARERLRAVVREARIVRELIAADRKLNGEPCTEYACPYYYEARELREKWVVMRKRAQAARRGRQFADELLQEVLTGRDWY